jgi:hypothetical protein
MTWRRGLFGDCRHFSHLVVVHGVVSSVPALCSVPLGWYPDTRIGVGQTNGSV